MVEVDYNIARWWLMSSVLTSYWVHLLMTVEDILLLYLIGFFHIYY